MQSFLSYAVLVGGLGFNSSTLKLCSEDRPHGEKIYLYKRSLKYAIIFAICSLSTFLILNYLGLLIQNKHFQNPLSLYMLSVLPMTVNSIDIAFLQSQREFVKLSKINLITRLTTIVLIISLTYFNGLYGFVLANVTGTIFSSSLLLINVNKLNRGIEKIAIENPFHLHIKYSGFAFLSNVTYQASVYFDMVLLNYLVKDDLKSIGSYGFATIVISFLTIITASFQQVLIPVFSNVSTIVDEWERTYKKYLKIYLIGTFIIGISALTIFPIILEIVYGAKYVKIGFFVAILSVAWIFKSIYSLQSSAMFGLGKLQVIFKSSLLLVCIGLPINFLMIKNFGVIGAGIANLCTSLCGLLIYKHAFSSVVKKIKRNNKNNPF